MTDELLLTNCSVYDPLNGVKGDYVALGHQLEKSAIRAFP